MADEKRDTIRSTLQDKLLQSDNRMSNQFRTAGRFLTPKSLLIGASMLGAGLVTGCSESSTDADIDETLDKELYADSTQVEPADNEWYLKVGEKEVLGCEDTEFEAYSLTGKSFDSVDYLTKDTCGPINPAGSTNIDDDVDDLVGFSALIRINDTDPAVAQMQYVSCYPRGGRLLLTDGKPDFESIECFVDEEKSEGTRNAVGIRGTIYGVDFDEKASNNWKLDSKEMDYANKKTVPVFENIQDEKFFCEPKYSIGYTGF